MHMEAPCHRAREHSKIPLCGQKEKLHRKEKIQIATAVAHMVKEAQVVILDSGTTTTAAIARALRHHENLTIVTSAVNIAAELTYRSGPERIAKRPCQPRPSARSSCLIRFSCSASGRGCPSLLPSA